MCRADDPSGELGRPGRMVQIIVPTDTPGLRIVRGIGIWGRQTSDHCEVVYDNVRVPTENTLGRVGDGHAAAQDRLGAGRVFHCMNSVGAMWRAFDLMTERAANREVHGGLLKDKQFIQGFIADSLIDIQAARLMTLHAAEKIDQDPELGPYLRDQGVRSRRVPPGRGPRDPGIRRGGYRQRLPPCRNVPGGEIAPPCRWPR